MVAFGVAGYLLRKLEVPLVPVILGILLGNQMEDNLRRALTISDGDWSILWASPLAIGLWAFAIAGFVAPMVFGRFVRPRAPAELAETADPD
jgi:putative tricarboxylic transport membrane protein